MTVEEIVEHIDRCIRLWRDKEADEQLIASCYIDAYQSMRVTITGKTLPR